MVARALEPAGIECEFVGITTRGDADRSSPIHTLGESIFTREIERSLLAGRIDLAVHSLKDLPTATTAGLSCPAYLPRADPRDALIVHDPANGTCLEDLSPGCVIGTGSPRRSAFLRASRPDVVVRPVRGNVPTRIARMRDGEYGAMVLAAAGLHRLDLESEIAGYLSPEEFVPAPAQGTIAVQARDEDVATLDRLSPLDHAPTRACVTAERAFLAEIEGGCRVPAGALAAWNAGELVLRVRVCSPDGALSINRAVSGPAGDPGRLGRRAAREVLAAGADRILDDARREAVP